MASVLELLVPYRKRELRSGLPVSDAARAIADQVEPRRWLRAGSGSRAFEGTVDETGFDVQRIIRYRNSFLPRIRGEIRPDAFGCSISVTMTLSAPVVIFIAIVLLMVTTAVFESTSRGVGVSAAEFAVIWLMTSGGFAFEAAKAERVLTKIFKATRGAQA